ncbi:hypothetical protein ACGF5C_29385 [Micromonospora sp. NPDC047620]|uniref:hypothetical protein n=1 Tax=Micromonospora sp. NPDC047620 TaxID=3364251 RepID=UPI003712FA7D
MTDSHPPYGGQPDPNVTPWSGPPAPQGGYPGYGQPGQPPQFGAPVPPPQKSNKGLIIGLSAAAVVVLLVLCGAGVGFVLVNDDDDPTPVASATPSGSSEPGTDATPTPGQSESQDPGNSNNAVTARYSSDLGDVCEGSQILNAAPYSGASGAKAYVFSNNPDRLTFWSSKSVASNKPYYAKSADFESVSVVGCLKFVEGSEGTPRKCQYKDSSDKQVTIDYISSRYELTFYAAKTGEKIGDGGTVSAPANRCPSFISYNKNTMKSYASPDSGTIEAALDKFLS